VKHKHTYRTLWISDIHLGTRGCKAELLLDFLRHTKSETLYLVGDVVDGWQIRRSWFWRQSHNDVIQKILRKARKGTRVVYIPGNHDEFLRDYVGQRFGGIELEKSALHVTADGRRLLVLHGDEFDGLVSRHRWLAHLGDNAYKVAQALNHLVALVRRWLGMPYWSLSAHLKRRVKSALAVMDGFSAAVVAEARRWGVDGVVCGHVHHAEMREVDGVLYLNDGDWVESCTALAEHFDGRLEILDWTALRQSDLAVEAVSAA
jgi:UDP-2,3-diacylglucosamine pyrophosphatase LpxH